MSESHLRPRPNARATNHDDASCRAQASAGGLRHLGAVEAAALDTALMSDQHGFSILVGGADNAELAAQLEVQEQLKEAQQGIMEAEREKQALMANAGDASRGESMRAEAAGISAAMEEVELMKQLAKQQKKLNDLVHDRDEAGLWGDPEKMAMKELIADAASIVDRIMRKEKREPQQEVRSKTVR